MAERAGAIALQTHQQIVGVVEIIRCVICIQQGEWPSREEDVEEVGLDRIVAPRQPQRAVAR